MTLPAIGAHVDGADPVTAARERGAELSQFFLGDPQGWRGPEIAYPGGAEALKDAASGAGVALYVHAPYVINVASNNNRIRIPSRKLLLSHARAAASIGAAGLVVHPGHVGKGEDPASGIAHWCKAVAQLGADLPDGVALLLENTAGGDNAMARRWDRLAALWDAVAGAADGAGVSLGFCLDTCHAHAGGEPLEGLVERTQDITGRIDLLHCNDSRDAFGSGADRHANLGDGSIAAAELAAVVRAAGAPVVCETPGGLDGHRGDLATVRTWLEENHSG